MPEDLDPDGPEGVAAKVHGGPSRLWEAEGLAPELRDLPPGHYGSYDPKEGRIVLGRALSGVERAATLAHELAHHLLHREDDGPTTKAVRETEAEGVSFAVLGYFGFDKSRFTFAYVALQAEEPEVLKAALSRIQKATHRLIQAVESVRRTTTRPGSEGRPLPDLLGRTP